MISTSYPIELHKDDNDTILVTSPDVPELTTFGETQDEAIDNARGALIAALDSYMERGWAIPSPSLAEGRIIVTLPTLIVAKLALYSLMKEQGVSKMELARRLKVDERQVRRMLDLTHRGRFDDLDQAFYLLGRKPRLELDAA